LGFRHLYSMEMYLKDRGISLPPLFTKAFPRYHLVEVPLPNIFNVINGLYRSLGNPGVRARIDSIEPDQQLNVSAPQVRIGTNFSLTAGHSSHARYKSYLKAMSPTTNVGAKSVAVDGTGVQIAVIDTGLEPGKPVPASYSDFVIPNAPQGDVDGHGT